MRQSDRHGVAGSEKMIAQTADLKLRDAIHSRFIRQIASILAFFVAVSLLAPQSVRAAIAVDIVTTAPSAKGVAGISWSHTVSAGPNRLLVVSISFRDGNVSADSVTYNGVPLVADVAINSPGNQNRTEIWHMVAPPVGTATVTIAMSAKKDVAATSISFTGVNQSTPLGSPVSAAGQSTGASVTATSAVGELVLDTVTANGDANGLVVNASQTQQWNFFSGPGDASSARSGGSTKTGASSVAMSWTLNVSKPWSVVAVPIKPAPTPVIGATKNFQIVSDPANGVVNPKIIPGAYGTYSIALVNTGSGTVDPNAMVITDLLPATIGLYVGDLGGGGAGPVGFANGATPSGLSYTFTSLSSTTDDVDFSNNGGTTFTYVPAPDASGYDLNVNAIRINPKGTFSGASGGTPSTTLSFRAKIK